MIHIGDCIEVMASMPADSVDAVVTDPPYGLEFMGKEWDSPAKWDKRGLGPERGFKGKARAPVSGFSEYRAGTPFQVWCQAWGREALRVTKPGGYLLAFGGTRTHHRLVCGLEDAGWMIRDELDWIYASGFPKGKANLKPAHEPIVLARKPGPLRLLAIDATRIGTEQTYSRRTEGEDGTSFPRFGKPPGIYPSDAPGRWPSNLLLSDPELFDVANPYVVGSGAVTQDGLAVRHRSGGNTFGGDQPKPAMDDMGYGDSGGYSRFFGLSVRMDGCQYCGAPDAESSSRVITTPATSSDSTPEIARTNGSAGTDPSAESVASSSKHPTIPTAHQNARLWDDEESGSSSAADTTNGIETTSSNGSEPTTPSTPRSRRPATLPRSASLLDPASSAAAPATSSATTTTTPARWMCDSCAVLVTRASTLDETFTGQRDFLEVPADRPDSPRYFIVPKADRADREPVLRGQLIAKATHTLEEQTISTASNRRCRTCGLVKFGQPHCECSDPIWDESSKRENAHPTVKPVDLMRHLVRLVTPVGGTVLDPFLGSGSTAIACELEGFPWVGIEKEAEYVAIAEARLNGTQRGLGLDVGAPTPQRSASTGHWPAERTPGKDGWGFSGQLGLEERYDKPPEEAA